ncbi:MAG TPA: hypothetical protein VM736_11750 [Gemmatimonadales bacterium]|nr:hypothetical protein [Gemmatimonadales bacterium]
MSSMPTPAQRECGLLAPGDFPQAASRYVAVLAGRAFAAELERQAVFEWRWGTPQEMHARLLRCHEHHRSTFEITLRTDGGSHTLIGKVFAQDHCDMFRVMDALARAGLGAAAEFAIPQPLAYFPALHVLLEEKVPGPSAKEVLLAGDRDGQMAAMERCARWLGRFHAAAPPRGSVYDERTHLEHWAEQVRSCAAGHRGLCERLVEKLGAATPASDGAALRAGHGSYMPGHVLLSGSRTVAIDLDECDIADPARDVGYFMVACQRVALKHLGSLHALDEPAACFLRAYAAATGGQGGPPGRRGGGVPGAVAHVPFYRALECLHRARHDVVKRIPARPDWAAMMLEEGVRVLS